MLDELVVIGTKDGKIKMINIEKGESYKTIQCTDANLIELILIERTSKQCTIKFIQFTRSCWLGPTRTPRSTW